MPQLHFRGSTRLGGTIGVDADCLVLVQDDGTRYVPIWTEAARLERDRQGWLVRDVGSGEVVRPGDRVIGAGGERDSTTPAAMAGLVHELLAGDILSRDSQARLSEWMHRPIRLRTRLRADLPPPSGGENRGVSAGGEIDRLYPRGQGAVIVATYIAGGDSRPIAREAAFEAVARAVAAAVPGSALPSDPPRINYPVG